MSKKQALDSFETADGYSMKYVKTLYADTSNEIAEITKNAHALGLRVTMDVHLYKESRHEFMYDIHLWDGEVNEKEESEGAGADETD